MNKNFNSFGDFARYLENVAAKKPQHDKALLKAVGQHVEDEAKRKMGVYQDADGPYEAWPQLAESTQEDRVRKGFSPNDPLFRTGELMHSISHHVERNNVLIGSTSDIMVYQELGTDRIPPRPVLGLAMFQSRAFIKKAIDLYFLTWLLNKGFKIE